VRFGLVIEGNSFEELAARAATAEAAGVEIAWLAGTVADDTALLRAASLASTTTVMRLAACVQVGGHPLEIAEAAAVVDNCSNGRLILVLESSAEEDDDDLLSETVDVILAATAPRPFRHTGKRWTIPANLPENDQHEERLLVTPQVVQTELPVWLLGAGAETVARSRQLPLVATSEREGRATAGQAGRGPRVLLSAVPASRDGRFSADELVADLLGQREAWGVDTAVLRFPADLSEEAWATAVARVARHVRPRLLLHELPAGVETHWKEVLVP
jgi:alkanesulfonate monooxygenase SsuD/methylene tetrahydromethanopterin reductase-like flavin-dependent oxidoreductase (luciferase family)